MNEKEKLFCRFYVLTGNAREAAARAGYRLMPERWGMKLLEREEVQERIAALAKEEKTPESGLYGLRRLAFGSIADPVRLLWKEEAPEPAEIEAMDLCMIAEIKRPKGGGMEIKFFDRIKAMEQLCQWDAAKPGDSALPFYQALSEGAKRLKGADGA